MNRTFRDFVSVIIIHGLTLISVNCMYRNTYDICFCFKPVILSSISILLSLFVFFFSHLLCENRLRSILLFYFFFILRNGSYSRTSVIRTTLPAALLA